MFGKLGVVAAGLLLLGQGLIMQAAEAEPRVALVVGNSHYGADIGSLPNPVNDAALIAQALQQTGFQVIKVTDADQKKMKRAIKDFGEKLAAAGPTATGLFFYAGHGVQVNGTNYLVPIGAEIANAADVDIESVAADTILQQMEFAGSRVNIVVLDACRNNPLQRGLRSITRGLAPMDAAQGTFIAYSTAPGSVAADGSGKNSPYTQALAKTIVQPGVGIEEAFRDVRAQVMAATGSKQIPWDSSSLTAPFYFKGQATAAQQFTTASQPAATTQKPAAAQSPANVEAETTFWKSIDGSKNADDYQAYLQQFPNGTFAGLAKTRLASLGAGVPREQPAVPAIEPVSVPAAAPVTTAQPDTDTDTDTEEASTTDAMDAATAKKCAIRDDTRSDSDICRRNRHDSYGGGGGTGGSRSTGSAHWK